VVSIKPVVVGDDVKVTMEVSAAERARVLEMVRRMEASPRFPAVGITNESTRDQGRLTIDIQADYAPVRTQ